MNHIPFVRTPGERARNHAEANRRWRARNIEKVREYGRRNAATYRECHKDRLKEIKAREYKRNRERYLERSKAWKLANPERYKAQMKASYERYKARKKQKRCISCESILKEQNKAYCSWCIGTYQLQNA